MNPGSSPQACTLVSSRGILHGCEVHAAAPESSQPRLYDHAWDSLAPGATVYVCASALGSFAAVLEHLTAPIVLVSGDADESVPHEVFATQADFLRFVEHPRLLHWHAQNLVARHPKLSALPIGLDYHTMARGPTSWGPRIEPLAQESLLQSIARAASPLAARLPRAYANFQFTPTTRHGADRHRALDALPVSLVDYEPAPVPRATTWRRQADYAFVISPHGNGLDCHRTWEALCLGCIPIVRSSPLDVLYEGLPVYIVQDWREVTAASLCRVLDDFARRPSARERLTLGYWRQRILASAGR